MNLTEYTRDHLSLTNGAYLALVNLLFAFLFIHLWQLRLPVTEWMENLGVTIGLIMGGIAVMIILMMGNNRRHPHLGRLFLQSLLFLGIAFGAALSLFYPDFGEVHWLERFLEPLVIYLVVAIFSGYTTFFRLNIARIYAVDQRVFAFMLTPFILLPLYSLGFTLLRAFLDLEQLDLAEHTYDIAGMMTIVTTLYTFISLKLYRALSFNRNLFIFLTLLSMMAYLGLYLYAIL